MKLAKISILVVLLVTLCSELLTAQNNSERRLQFSLNMGFAVQAAPQNFIDYWDIGPGVGLGIGYTLNPTVTLQLYGSYHNFGFNKDGFRDDLNLSNETKIDGGSAEVGTVMGNVILNYKTLNPALVPYFKIGAGFFRSVLSDIDFENSNGSFTVDSGTEATFGANSAIGINYFLKEHFSLFIEIKYTTAFFEGRRTQYLPMNIGISF